jgi:hypothetical protein
VFAEKFTTGIFVAHSLQIDSRKKKLPKPSEIQLSPDIFSWIELAQILNIPRVQNILTLGIL